MTFLSLSLIQGANCKPQGRFNVEEEQLANWHANIVIIAGTLIVLIFGLLCFLFGHCVGRRTDSDAEGSAAEKSATTSSDDNPSLEQVLEQWKDWDKEKPAKSRSIDLDFERVFVASGAVNPTYNIQGKSKVVYHIYEDCDAINRFGPTHDPAGSSVQFRRCKKCSKKAAAAIYWQDKFADKKDA